MKKVLVLRADGEKNIPYICKALKNIGQDYLIIDIDNLTETSLSITEKDWKVNGKISVNGKSVCFDEIKSVLCRRLPSPGTRGKGIEELFIKTEFLQSLWSFSTTFNCYWMNPPLNSKFLIDHNKLYQAIWAKKYGLLVPNTLISNDPDEIIEFCEKQGGEVALKTVRSVTFEKESGGREGIYTQLFTTNELKEVNDKICFCPIMVQQYIRKKLELRVTLVGQELFTCAIHSQDSERTKHDWRRYDHDNVIHEKFELPLEIKNKIIRLVSVWDLKYAAIDIIMSPDDKYYFLEINPSGQFGWIEHLTGMPITLKIAEALSQAS